MALETLCDTTLTIDWLVNLLKDKFENEKAKLESFSAEKIGIGQGYLSKIIQVKLNWKDASTKEMPERIVLKVPTCETIHSQLDSFVAEGDAEGKDSMSKLMDKGLPMLHRIEINCYNLLSSADETVCAMPRFYYGREISNDDVGVLVLEDLSEVAGTVNIGDGFTLEQVYQVVDAIVLFQSHVMKLDDQNKWKKLVERSFDQEDMNGFSKSFGQVFAALQAARPDYFTIELIEKVKFAFHPKLMERFVLKFSETFDVPDVLVHGDMWSNNMLFEKDDNNKLSNKLTALIDWQVGHAGNMTEDIGRLLVAGCSGELRRKETQNVLEYYYINIQKKLGDHKCPFSFDDVLIAYDAQFPMAAMFYTFGVPLMIDGGTIDGPKKEERAEALYLRGRDALEDTVLVKERLPEKYFQDET